MLCSLLHPVIAVILSFGTPPFCNLCTCVFSTLMVCESLATFVKASLFCNCLHELLDFTLTNWLLGVLQCWLRFFGGSQIQWTTCGILLDAYTLAIPTKFTQYRSSPDRNTCCMTSLFCFTSPSCLVFVGPSVHSTHSISLVPGFLTNLKSSSFIWRCSWTILIPKMLTQHVPQWVVQAFSTAIEFQGEIQIIMDKHFDDANCSFSTSNAFWQILFHFQGTFLRSRWFSGWINVERCLMNFA